MVYLLLGTGFEEMEAITPCDLLRRAGVEVQTVGVNGKIVCGSHGIGVETDISLAELDPAQAEMIILPGGLKGVASLNSSPEALEAVRQVWQKGAFVAAICAGPTVLAGLHIPDGRKATCYPGHEPNMGDAVMVENAACVRDGRLITGTSAGCAVPFGLELVAALKGQETADRIAAQIVIR